MKTANDFQIRDIPIGKTINYNEITFKTACPHSIVSYTLKK